MDSINDISDGGLPRVLSGLGQTSTGRVFGDGTGTVMTLMQGVRAPRQVTQMQKLLNRFGYKLAEDGIFGAGSVAAVKGVQIKLKMSPTGVYDKALDERIVGMNQSGIIDATQADVKAVVTGQTQPQTPDGKTTGAGGTGNGSSITPVVTIDGKVPTVGVTAGGQLQVQPTGIPTPGGSSLSVQLTAFAAKAKAKWAQLLADPNFKYYAAGACVVSVTGLIVLTMPKKDSPRTSQMSGLYEQEWLAANGPRRSKSRKGKRKAKKSRKSKK